MVQERKDIEKKYKWKIEDIFASMEEWESLYKVASEKIDFSAFRGKLNSVENFCEYFIKEMDLESDLERLYLFAFMHHDEDARDSQYTALLSRVQELLMKAGADTAFVTPELTALDEKVLKSFIKDERLQDYNYILKSVLRSKPHVLSAESEQVLAMGGQVFDGFHNIFGMIDNADLKFAEIKKPDGEKVKLSHGMYSVLLSDPDRRVRKKAFEAYYQSYIDLINTISATYIGNVNKDVYLSKVRKYNSCLDKALSGEDVDETVYNNLLESVNAALPAMHDYIKIRKHVLKLKQMHMYDIYTPLVENAEIKLSYEDSFKLVKEGLAPLGKDYIALLDKAYNEGWIDVFENVGKRSGAYSISVYSAPHPYVLLNHQPTTHSVFTIAHELGHAMHSYFSTKNQPHAKSDYTIFVAEVASTVNEVLLLKHIIKTCTDVNLKKYLLSYYMDMIRTTLFRQTMFAEFEYWAHDSVEKGVPLTKDSMNQAYLELNKKYYGKSIVSDDQIAYEWARIPHFYRAFYVYKYATGITSAISIAERILSEGQPAVDDYFKFLSSGASDAPNELLKLAGVDLTKKTAFKAAMKSFKETLKEFKELCK